MGNLTDTNVVKMPPHEFTPMIGDAHEHLVLGILMRLGLDVGLVDVSKTPYDLIVKLPKGNKTNPDFLRVQVKTVQKSLPLGAGSRGGIDREYKSSAKEYKYTTEHNDVMIGVKRDTLDLYVFPTQFATNLGKSVALSKIEIFKNNWDIFVNWQEKNYLDNLRKKFDILIKDWKTINR